MFGAYRLIAIITLILIKIENFVFIEEVSVNVFTAVVTIDYGFEMKTLFRLLDMFRNTKKVYLLYLILLERLRAWLVSNCMALLLENDFIVFR